MANGPRLLATRLRAAGPKISAALLAAEAITVKEAMQAATRLSSGGYSLAQLRAAGHPYARRAPDPSFDAAIINMQSGEFLNAWRSAGPYRVGGVVKSKIVNNSRPAKYMSGTKTMIARPIDKAILAAVSPDRKKRIARIRQAIRKSILG